MTYNPSARAKALEAEFEDAYSAAATHNRERASDALWAATAAYYADKDAGGDRLSCLEAQLATFRSQWEKRP